jgi:hypothetical protein
MCEFLTTVTHLRAQYHILGHNEILHSAHSVYLCNLYGSQNKRLFSKQQ